MHLNEHRDDAYHTDMKRAFDMTLLDVYMLFTFTKCVLMSISRGFDWLYHLLHNMEESNMYRRTVVQMLR